MLSQNYKSLPKQFFIRLKTLSFRTLHYKKLSWQHYIVGREGNRSARWIREWIEIRKQDIQGHRMNRDAGTYTLSHLNDALFSATATSCGENQNRKSFQQRCCRNVSDKQERLDRDLIILITNVMSPTYESNNKNNNNHNF